MIALIFLISVVVALAIFVWLCWADEHDEPEQKESPEEEPALSCKPIRYRIDLTPVEDGCGMLFHHEPAQVFARTVDIDGNVFEKWLLNIRWNSAEYEERYTESSVQIVNRETGLVIMEWSPVPSVIERDRIIHDMMTAGDKLPDFRMIGPAFIRTEKPHLRGTRR